MPALDRSSSPSGARLRCLLWPLLALLPVLPFQEALHAVTKVIDGDTIEVEVDGQRERVRYIGVDTPERDDPREVVRRLAARATEANEALVGGRRVRLELDVERRRYGRLLAYVWVGDTLVNERLLRGGHAQTFTVPPNVRYAERFLEAQRTARAERRGLWGEAAAEGGLAAERDAATPAGGPRIGAADADEHVGRFATVCGRVVGARYVRGTRGRPTFLNFERSYPRQLFTVVIWEAARSRFETPPEETFEGRDVCVEGWIQRHRGTPQVVVEDPAQLTLPPDTASPRRCETGSG